MEIYDEGLKIADVEKLVIYDSSKKEFRLAVWEENGVLHVCFPKPVVIATTDEDLSALPKEA